MRLESLNLNPSNGNAYTRCPELTIHTTDTGVVLASLLAQQAVVERSGRIRHTDRQPVRLGPIDMASLPATVPMVNPHTGEPLDGQTVNIQALQIGIISVVNYVFRQHLAPEPAPEAGEAPATE